MESFWNGRRKRKKKGIRGKENINKVKSYLRDIIIDLQSSDTWKIQLTIAINFISSKNTEEECNELNKRQYIIYTL